MSPRLRAWLLSAMLLVSSLGAVLVSAPAQAACPGTIPTANGQATESVTVGGSGVGTYRIWSRIYLPVARAGSYYLQINGSCFVVGGASLPAATWTWVNYQDGNTASLMNVSLTGGSTYTVTMTGNTPGLRVGRTIFTTDTTCVPSGDGALCASPATDTPPTVSLTAPTAGSTVSGTVTLSATASDNIGVNSVAFAVDGTIVNTDTTSPYSYAWPSTGATNASHSITAIATDTANQTTTSAAVSVTVSNSAPDTTPPSAFTMNAITTVTSSQVTVPWNATTDPVVGGQTTSGLSGYRVLRGGTQIASVGSGVTSYIDSTVSPATTYTYQIQAFDVAGNTTNSTNTQAATTPASLDTYFPTVSNASFNLHSTATTTTSITMGWSQVADATNPANTGAPVSGTAGYHIYRNGTMIASPLGQTTVTYTDSGLSPGTTYTYAISAFDNGGNGSNASAGVAMQTVFSQDTTAPTTPTGFVVSTKTHNTVNLSWAASTDPTVAGQTTSGIAGYDITRNGIALPATTAQSYSDTGLTASTSYTYIIKARDGSGNLSGAASLSTSTNSTPDTTPPSAPTGVSAQAIEAGHVDLTWVAATDSGGSGLAGYNIYRTDKGATPLNTGLVTLLSYSDTLVAGSTTYSYQVEAVDGAGNKTKSAVASATTPASADTSPPTVPSNRRVTKTTINSITMAWNASTDNVGVVGYHIFQNDNYLGDVTTLSYTATGLNPATTYLFQIVAFDAGGNGSNTPNLSATTAGVPSGFSSTGEVTTDGSAASQAQVSTGGTDVTVTLPTDLPVSANAIVKVEYYVDGVLAYTTTTAPFSAKINTRKFKNGTHQLTTKTYDAKGGMQSATQSLVINNSSSWYSVASDTVKSAILDYFDKLTHTQGKNFWLYLLSFWTILSIVLWVPFELIHLYLKKHPQGIGIFKPAPAGGPAFKLPSIASMTERLPWLHQTKTGVKPAPEAIPPLETQPPKPVKPGPNNDMTTTVYLPTSDDTHKL